MEWNCGNGIAEIVGEKNFCNWFVAMPLPKWGVKKKIGVVKSGMEFGNAIATIPFHTFFFFKEMISAHNFYNKF